MNPLFQVVALSFVLVTSPVAAGVITFERQYEYQASEADSKLSCRTIALEQVKRLLLEELGTYLQSETVIKNYELTKDEITTMTAGVVSTIIADEQWDGKTYSLTAILKTDPDEVAKAVLALRSDKEKDMELEEARKRADEAMKQVERLRKELAESEKNVEKEVLTRQYRKATEALHASDLFEQAHVMWLDGKYRGAAKILDQAISANDEYAEAYALRGAAYLKLSDYQNAVNDFDRAIGLNPQLAKAFLGRGIARRHMNEHRKAIADIEQALKLQPSLDAAYFHRALVWREMGSKRRFIEDLKTAARLGHERAEAMLRRRGEPAW